MLSWRLKLVKVSESRMYSGMLFHEEIHEGFIAGQNNYNCYVSYLNKAMLVFIFYSENNGKAILSCYISKELVASKNLNAGTIVRELGKHIQGGGGGQPFFATAGGKNPKGIEAALEAAKGYIS